MAHRLLEHGDTSAEFGPVPAGSVIVAAEVGIIDAGGNLTNTSMESGEQWTVEMADANLPEDRRIWTAVHFTGATVGQSDYFNGITETNQSIDFFTSDGGSLQTSDGYVYRIRKTGGTVATNTNVAFSWDIGTMRQWR